MHSSKTFVITSALSLVTLLATGCFRPGTHPTDGEQIGEASFTIAPITGDSKVTGHGEGLVLANRKMFSIKACIKDIRTEEPVENARFILSNSGVEKEYVTGPGGCFAFSEEIAYDSLADEAYLVRSYVLRASPGSKYSGRRKLQVALNPWKLSEASPEVVDLASVPAGAKKIDSSATAKVTGGKPANDTPQSTPKLVAIDQFALASLPVMKQAAGFNRVVQFSFRPFLSVKDFAGQARKISLESAKLQVSAVLVAVIPSQDGKESSFKAWSTQAPVAAQKSGDSMRVNLDVSFIPNMIEVARYALVVRIEPAAGSTNNLKPFEGVFDLGSHAQVATSTILPEKLRDSNMISGSTFSFEAETKDLALLPPPAAEGVPGQVPPVGELPPAAGSEPTESVPGSTN